MGEKDDIVPVVAIEVDDETFARLGGTALATLVVEVLLEDMEVKDASPLLLLVVEPEELQEVPGCIKAKQVKLAVGIKITAIDGVVGDVAKIGGVPGMDGKDGQIPGFTGRDAAKAGLAKGKQLGGLTDFPQEQAAQVEATGPE